MISKTLIVSVLAALTVTSTARMAYQLSAGFDDILSNPLSESFKCDDLPYGYYADTDNDCEVFHVCLPIADDIGALVETAHFSFVCGNGTVFSQDSLTCVHAEDAYPCAESRSLYDISNAEFGRIPTDYEY